jgi:hypothetical protein
MNKKLLLASLGLFFMAPMGVQAQEIGDDVTSYIANAGFDEDLTFQADGSKKAITSSNTSLSDRSWALIAADSTIYAQPKETSGQSRPDGRKLEAVNGFIGRVNGWTIESNQTFPKCEWVYFGTIPYALGATAIPIADDGSTYLEVPNKPAEFDTDDNLGFAYLRAGWGGRAVYKQVVKLPCAVYELSYWAKNINPSATNGSNLTQIQFRKTVVKDETGFNDTEWTRHAITFTPTTEFTMQFGFESSGGSMSNPFLCIDGIQLVKVDEADEADILKEDIFADLDSLLDLQTQVMDYQGIYDELNKIYEDIQDIADNTDDVEKLRAAYATLQETIVKFGDVNARVEEVNALLNKINDLLNKTQYPGYNDLQAVSEKYENFFDEATYQQLVDALDELNTAIRAYYLSQEGSEENPADFTFLVKNPWFATASAEPIVEADGTLTWPKKTDETGAEVYTDGTAPADATSEGWYIGVEGGDQRLNWKQGRICWNAWRSGFTGQSISINQDITDLPNGYYKVAADLNTQDGMNNDQHTYAKSTAGKAISPYLTQNVWDDALDGTVWETLTTTDKVLVTDGKLTIGAEATGGADGAIGWFLVTNFKLYYLGQATPEEIAEAYNAKIATANAQVDTMHFAADKAEFAAAIAANSDKQGIEAQVAAMGALNDAQAVADSSEAKYAEIMEPGKTIPAVADSLATTTAFGEGRPFAEYGYNHIVAYVKSAEATFRKVDEVLNTGKAYINNYAPAYRTAATKLASYKSASAKSVLEEVMNKHKAELLAEVKTPAIVDEYVAELNSVVVATYAQEAFDNNETDWTFAIQNPDLASEDGWTFERGNGDKNTTSGQYMIDGSHRYIDSYNGNGLEGFSAEQKIENIPNGTYTVKLITRTAGKGAFILTATGEEAADTTWTEIVMNEPYYDHDIVLDSMPTDKYGPIWEAAVAKYQGDDYTEVDELIAIANNGIGRGWRNAEVAGIVVKNHTLTIGVSTDSVRTGVKFEGNWFSATDWQLIKTADGDNAGWTGPLTGINEVNAVEKVFAAGIYNLNGVKMNTANLPKGIYIVREGNKAKKIMIK